jgi:ABC-2 type transport system ATP-binding protein
VLLLDEPTTGVDPVARREFWDILRDAVNRDGVTVLVSTPYMDEADRCHVVGFMRGGKILASDTPRNLQKLIPSVVLEVQAAPRHAAELALRALPGVRDVQVFGDRLHVVADAVPAEDALRRHLSEAGVTLQGLRPIPPTMEDVFMHLQRSVVSGP